MKRYSVASVMEGKIEYFFIRDMERFLKRELGGNELEVLTEESGVPFRIV